MACWTQSVGGVDSGYMRHGPGGRWWSEGEGWDLKNKKVKWRDMSCQQSAIAGLRHLLMVEY